MATFEVGEIAIIVGFLAREYEPYRGSQCEVVEVVANTDPLLARLTPWAHYQVRLLDGFVRYASTDNLQKIPPKQDWNTLCRLDETPLDVRAKTPEHA